MIDVVVQIEWCVLDKLKLFGNCFVFMPYLFISCCLCSGLVGTQEGNFLFLFLFFVLLRRNWRWKNAFCCFRLYLLGLVFGRFACLVNLIEDFFVFDIVEGAFEKKNNYFPKK